MPSSPTPYRQDAISTTPPLQKPNHLSSAEAEGLGIQQPRGRGSLGEATCQMQIRARNEGLSLLAQIDSGDRAGLLGEAEAELSKSLLRMAEDEDANALQEIR
ncbi:hypothetical protein NL676_034600 [Syzygium grande]|nr:hypothetical protein NL676_034600 [Syzygium grande]